MKKLYLPNTWEMMVKLEREMHNLNVKEGGNKMRKTKYWIQETGIKKHPGKLHAQLRIPAGKKISSKLLKEISSAKLGTKVRGHRVTLLLKKRAVLAKTLRRH